MPLSFFRLFLTFDMLSLCRSESQPAFFHAYEYLRGQKLGIIKLNPAVSDKLATDSLERTIHPRHLPMLVKPRPWVNYKEGGYLYNKC